MHKSNTEIMEEALSKVEYSQLDEKVTFKMFYIEVYHHPMYCVDKQMNIGFFRTRDEAETRALEYMCKERPLKLFGKEVDKSFHFIVQETELEQISCGRCVIDGKHIGLLTPHGDYFWEENADN